MSESDGDTKSFESAQALFCAMADYLGSTKAKKVLDYKTYPTYSLFKSNNKKLIVNKALRLTWNFANNLEKS